VATEFLASLERSYSRLGIVEVLRMNFRSVSLVLVFVAFICLIDFTSASAQVQQQRQANGLGSIAGRVTVDGKPGAGVVIELLKTNVGSRRMSVTKVTTSKTGRYLIASIVPGTYDVAPSAPTLVVSNEGSSNQAGKSVTVEIGENVRGIDFELVSKGSISGRVTDIDGQPVAGETVELFLTGENGYSRQFFSPENSGRRTDEQGRYHISGVPPGRYLVSVGVPYGVASYRAEDTKRAYYLQTFHPDATEYSQALAVRVESGGETLDADITVGRPLKTYEISGQVVDADAGSAIPNVGLGLITKGSRSSTDMSGALRSSSTGGFRISAALPGHYVVYPESDAASNSYGDPLEFDLKDEDVTGLKINMHRAASISGLLTIETTSPALSNDRPPLGLFAETFTGNEVTSGGVSSPIGTDGTFRITGVRPGKVSLFLDSHSLKAPTNLRILRIERNGVDLSGELDVLPAEEVIGLRVIVGSGDSVLRGNVKIEGGTLEGLQLYVLYRPTNGDPHRYSHADLDARDIL
jgi:Carboxypeptidase regulatory-like domain